MDFLRQAIDEQIELYLEFVERYEDYFIVRIPDWESKNAQIF